jgi:DNA-binding SARP family transcriptional activator
VLEPDSTPRGTYLTTNSVGDVGFNCAAMHWLDVEVLEKRTKPVVGKPIDEVTSSAVAKLGKALELYTAELLEGFYEDWALRERERLRMLYLNSLAYLMHYHRHRGAYDKALTSGLQILRHDPLREQVHRDVMQLYLETGQRTLALRQYETCRALLATELGVPPMKATQDLYAQLLSESSSPPPAVASGDEPVTLEQVMRQLRAAIHDFGAAEAKLAHVIQLLERVSERRIRR